MSDYFFVVYIKNISPSQEDEVSGVCFEFGASGVEESLPFVQKNEKYEPVTIEKDETELKVYFESEPSENFISNLKSKFPKIDIYLEKLPNKDWLSEWKKGFESFPLFDGIWVVPSWLKPPAVAKEVLRIDPGMAFGTGTHETTKLASELLGEFWPRNKKNLKVLDVGTGTGILALLAEKLGAADVVTNDIDPEARRVARENKELNNSNIKIVEEDVSQIKGEFDLVIANIIDGVLVEIQTDLKARVKREGLLLLTGILLEREDLFKKQWDFDGFLIKSRAQKGEWVGYLIQKSL